MNGGPAGHSRLVVFLILAGGLSALLFFYTLGHRRPEIPADADHLHSFEPAGCLECHGPAGKDPRGKNHPLNDRCFDCHERDSRAAGTGRPSPGALRPAEPPGGVAA